MEKREEPQQASATPAKPKRPPVPETPKTPGKRVAWPGLLAIAVYLLALMGLSFYTLVAVWPGQCAAPPPAENGEVMQAAGEAPPTPTDAESETEEGDTKEDEPGTVRYLIWDIDRAGEVPLILLVLASGVLGGIIHAIRSFYWYIGHDALFTRWVAMYLLLPVVSGSIGIVFFLVIRGGFYTPTVAEGAINPLGFAALGGLVGLFSEQAVLKLRSIAVSFFQGGTTGADHFDKAGEQEGTETPDSNE